MKWNRRELQYLYKVVEETRDTYDKEAKDHAEHGEYNFASMRHNESFALTYVLNLIVKADNEWNDIKKYKLWNE
jgi:hypothetical protein